MGNQSSEQSLKKESIIFDSKYIGKVQNGVKQQLVNFWFYDNRYYLCTTLNLEIFNANHKLWKEGYFANQLIDIVQAEDKVYVLFDNQSLKYYNMKNLAQSEGQIRNIDFDKKQISFNDQKLKLISITSKNDSQLCRMIIVNQKNIVLGFSNGTVSVIRLVGDGIEQMYLNNYEQQIQNQQLATKLNHNNGKMEVIYEDIIKCKVQHILYCYTSQSLIVIHDNEYRDSLERNYVQQCSTIMVYKMKHYKTDEGVFLDYDNLQFELQKCEGKVISVQLDMQNKWLFVLTNQNTIYLWNYLNQNLVIKIPLSKIIEQGQFVDFKIQYLNIDGDIKLFLHAIQQTGNLLVSILSKDKSEVQWKGLKVLKAMNQVKVQKMYLHTFNNKFSRMYFVSEEGHIECINAFQLIVYQAIESQVQKHQQNFIKIDLPEELQQQKQSQELKLEQKDMQDDIDNPQQSKQHDDQI